MPIINTYGKSNRTKSRAKWRVKQLPTNTLLQTLKILTVPKLESRRTPDVSARLQTQPKQLQIIEPTRQPKQLQTIKRRAKPLKQPEHFTFSSNMIYRSNCRKGYITLQGFQLDKIFTEDEKRVSHDIVHTPLENKIISPSSLNPTFELNREKLPKSKILHLIKQDGICDHCNHQATYKLASRFKSTMSERMLCEPCVLAYEIEKQKQFTIKIV